MDVLYIVDHPTKGTQAFACDAAAAHYADGERVRCWVKKGDPEDWREVSPAEAPGFRRVGRRP